MASHDADDERLATFHDRESDRAVLHDQRNTQDILNCLLHKAFNGPVDQGSLLYSLTEMQASMRGIDSYLRKRVPSEIYTEYCPPHAMDLAQKVFDVPELLEKDLVEDEHEGAAGRTVH